MIGNYGSFFFPSMKVTVPNDGTKANERSDGVDSHSESTQVGNIT